MCLNFTISISLAFSQFRKNVSHLPYVIKGNYKNDHIWFCRFCIQSSARLELNL